MSTTFIIGRHTARSFLVEPASSVGPSDKKGCFNLKRLRASEETLEHVQVMAVLSNTLRSSPRGRSWTLKQLFDAALAGDHGHMLSSATYAAPTSTGIPGRLIVKGNTL